MDLFFDVYSEIKYDFALSRWVRISEKGIDFRIYSEDKLIVIVKSEEPEEREYVYLLACRDLIKWALRNYDHASRSTKEENKWITKLNEILSEGEEDEEHNPGA